jgi:hypothetical protein
MLFGICIVSFTTGRQDNDRATALTQNRKIDRGNPNPDNIGSDFNRFGLTFWPQVLLKHRHASVWKSRLTVLSDWRNAIAHQDFDPRRLHNIASLTLSHIREWRTACERLAQLFESVMGDHLTAIAGKSPW